MFSEQSVSLPEQIAGVPVRLVCLYKLWGLRDAGGGMEHPQDETLIKAGVAMRLAQDALALPRLESSDYQDADVPAYLQDAPPAGHYYGTLSYNNRRKSWTVRGEPCVIELCKRLFPGTDGGKRGEARFTDHRRIVGDLNWLMLRYPLQIAPRDRERWEKAISAARDYAAARQRIQDAPPQMEPRAGSFIGTLMPFQKAGLSWLCATPRALLADEMGLGKTLQALCCLCNTQAFPAILVVPPHLVRNWQAEIARFIRIEGRTPRVYVLRGLTPYALPEADIYIVHYLLLRGWKDVLPNLRFRAAVFDEAQELRRAGREKDSAASLLSESCERVIGLSGTPIYNQGGEIWNVVNILDYHFLGDWESFTREWCYGYGNNVVIKPDLLGEHLRREGLMLRRTKAEVLPELPEKRRLVQELHAFSPAFITGRESGAQKEEAAARFMQGRTNLCCVSLRAASGLNLQRASCVVFGELDWSPAVHSQAEDRAHRIGQRDSLLCYYLVSPQGSDADIQEALGLKVSQFLGLMGERAPTPDLMQSDADYARRYVEKLLSREV